MKTALIGHEGADFDLAGLTHWLASFSDYRGTLVLREPASRYYERVRHELARSGFMGLMDVLAYRLWHRLRWSMIDRRNEQEMVAAMRSKFASSPTNAPSLLVQSPNSRESAQFLESLQADIIIARCKTLLNTSIFAIPKHGTFVLHPGICPEYRNAHGCFWALSQGDFENVGSTLLLVDRGIDTGPIYGQYRLRKEGLGESINTIQLRAIFEFLAEIQKDLESFYQQKGKPIDTSGRKSAVWGQPRLSAYMRLLAGLRRVKSGS